MPPPQAHRVLRKKTHSPRPLSALTPIIASPISTPTVSTSADTADQEVVESNNVHSYLTQDTLATLWKCTPPTPPSAPALRSRATLRRRTRPPSPLHPRPFSLPNALSKHPTPPSSFLEFRRHSAPNITTPPPPPPYIATLQSIGSSRARFHISQDGGSDDEGNDGALENTSERSQSEGETTPGGSTDSEGGDKMKKEDVRRYHALMELLTTEVGYLTDLRVLVNIYLRHLPMLTSRSSSFLSGSTPSGFVGRTPMSTRSPPPTPPISPITGPTLPTANAIQTITPQTTKEKGKETTRYVLSDADIEVITRNAEELLRLHEPFVEDLCVAVSALGFTVVPGISETIEDSMPPSENIDTAIHVVSTKFATEASRFNSYQSFCSGHPEALRLIRKLQHQHPVEWNAFERQSSSLVSELLNPTFDTSLPQNSLDFSRISAPLTSTKRRHSLPSLDIEPVIQKTNAGLKVLPSEGKMKDNASRLEFMDYLIKPVQRICRYPLLFDQLKARKPGRRGHSQDRQMTHFRRRRRGSDVNVVVESASQAMRHVASSVDEANRRQSISVQSSLIASRILMAWSSPGSSTEHRAFHMLTPAFLSSLGACMLAGSFDVMHYHLSKSPSAAKPKYLGAFLYMGGYIVLVKVCKGKVYQPRHWFSLSNVDLTDLPDEDAKLPCSFLLSSRGHHFIMGASCRGEKETWIAAIRESLTVPTQWSSEPASSLHYDSIGDSNADNTSTPVNGDEVGLLPGSELPTISPLMQVAVTLDPSPRPMPSHSRRSSSASVKVIFTPLSSSDVFRRPSPAARSLVDRGLEDVLSEPCRVARYYATTHDEELFPGSKPSVSSFSRSSSGLSMAGAMGAVTKNKLTKRGSVHACGTKSESDTLPSLSSLKPKSASKLKKLRIAPVPIAVSSDSNDNLFTCTPDTVQDSPSPLSPCSSTGATDPSTQASLSTTPTVEIFLPDCPPKRSRSMVDNVRGLFYPQVTSPTASAFTVTSEELAASVESETAAPALLKWWSKESLRRRVRSAPDSPMEGIPSQPVQTHSDLARAPSPTEVSCVQDVHEDDVVSELPSLSQPHDVSTTTKRLSLFSPLTPRRFTTATVSTDSEPPRSQRSSLLQRLSPVSLSTGT